MNLDIQIVRHIWIVEGRHTFLYLYEPHRWIEVAMKLYADFREDLISWDGFCEGLRQLR